MAPMIRLTALHCRGYLVLLGDVLQHLLQLLADHPGSIDVWSLVIGLVLRSSCSACPLIQHLSVVAEEFRAHVPPSPLMPRLGKAFASGMP